MLWTAQLQQSSLGSQLPLIRVEGETFRVCLIMNHHFHVKQKFSMAQCTVCIGGAFLILGLGGFMDSQAPRKGGEFAKWGGTRFGFRE